MKAYSLDLRERVIQSEDSIRQTAQRYRVSVNFVLRLRRAYRETGSLTPKLRGGNRRPIIDAAGGQWLEEILSQEPSVTLAELCVRYEAAHGVKVSKSSMDRTLRRLHLTYKKTLADPERHTERVQALTRAYQSELAQVAVDQFVFLDEAGATLNLTLEYGRSLRGHRVTGEKPTTAGERISTVGALSCHGLVTALCYQGTLTSAVFLYFIEHFLVPCLNPGQVVILDNASAHRAEEVAEWIEAVGARVLYLPPYSPHLIPIELAWSKIKHQLRKAQARTVDALYHAWAEALKTISSADALGFFQHVGLCP